MKWMSSSLAVVALTLTGCSEYTMADLDEGKQVPTDHWLGDDFGVTAPGDVDRPRVQAPPTGCEDLYPEPTGQRFYVDPVSGQDDNDGSFDAPWASLQTVIDSKVDCLDADGQPRHSSAPVQGGDTIVLRGATGHEAGLLIKECLNSDYIHIVGEGGRATRLTSVHFKGAAFWSFEGLTFEKSGGAPMIRVTEADSYGLSHHIRLHDNTFTSGDLQTKSQYASSATDAIRFSHTDDSEVSCNTLYKVGLGVSASGDRIDVIHNEIAFFTRDALVNGGSFNRYIGNTVYDAIKLGDGHHDDFFQSHRGIYPDTATGIEVAYNVFMNRYLSEQPADTMGPTQCIGAFGDGPKTQWAVYNNLCKGDHWHGITLGDTHDSLIINNTVVGGGKLPGNPWSGWSTETTWINVSGTGNTVRNNLTTRNFSGGDHNFIVTADNLYDVFVDWDAQDLRLRPDGPAVDAGSAESAPVDDLRGQLRDGTPDIGAYEVVDYSSE
jgi:hypothetical protein